MMGCIIAKVVKFYVSDSLSKQSRDIARKKCGNLIEYRSPKTDQANSNSAQWPAMYGLDCTIRCKLCEQ